MCPCTCYVMVWNVTMFSDKHALTLRAKYCHKRCSKPNHLKDPAVDRWFIPPFVGFQPSKVLQDFGTHPQYLWDARLPLHPRCNAGTLKADASSCALGNPVLVTPCCEVADCSCGRPLMSYNKL